MVATRKSHIPNIALSLVAILFATGLAAVSSDHIRLYKALGGGWVPDTAAASADPAVRTTAIATP